MPSIVPIPLPPNEDYDHHHSIESSLYSLQSLLCSFDATIDSLENITARQSLRISSLTKRCQRVQKKLAALKSLGDDGKALSILSPSRLPSLSSASSNAPKTNPIRDCRNASNIAVLRVQDTFRQKDDENAKLSDEWLDRGSGFEEGHLCHLSEDYHTVPSILYNLKLEETSRLNQQQQQRRQISSLWSGADGVVDEDVSSVITNETGLTSMRRDQVLISSATEVTTSRRQADSGSQPHSCELLHDVYGVGMSSDAVSATGVSDGGGFFPSVTSLAELKTFIRDGGKDDNVAGSGVGTGGRESSWEGIEIKTGEQGGVKNEDTKKTLPSKDGEETEDQTQQVSKKFSKPTIESYRPEVVSDDAGLFQLPEDLPLPDVVNVNLAYKGNDTVPENDSIAPSRYVKKR